MAQAEEDVARFVAVTGSSRDQASFMLEATHGNFEQAVQMYLGTWPLRLQLLQKLPTNKCRQITPPTTTHITQSTTLGVLLRVACICCPRADSHQPPAQQPQPAQADANLRRRNQARPAGAGPGGPAAAGPAQHRRPRGSPGLLGLPFKLVASGMHVMASVVQLTFSLAGVLGDKVLPASVMRAARGEQPGHISML